jgi:serine/threonine-protein kinase
MWSRVTHDGAASTIPSAAAPPATRRTFVLFIDAAPARAEVWEGEHHLGQSPMQISIDNEAARKEPRRFVVRRAGFHPYAIVQGPSEENVRILASLVTSPGETAAPPAALPGPLAIKEHAVPPSAPAKAARGTAPRAEPAAPPAPAPAAPAATSAPAASIHPPAPSDIRLQR